jgi:hypothetical protein
MQHHRGAGTLYVVPKNCDERTQILRKKKGRPESTLKKSLGEDAYKACPLSRHFIFCASANSAIAVAYHATAIYKNIMNSAAFVRSQNQVTFVAVRQNGGTYAQIATITVIGSLFARRQTGFGQSRGQ